MAQIVCIQAIISTMTYLPALTIGANNSCPTAKSISYYSVDGGAGCCTAGATAAKLSTMGLACCPCGAACTGEFAFPFDDINCTNDDDRLYTENSSLDFEWWYVSMCSFISRVLQISCHTSLPSSMPPLFFLLVFITLPFYILTFCSDNLQITEATSTSQ
jgi:hypothetical protein